MKCDAAQNRLLAPADPNRLPDAVRDHLAGCEACRRFRDQAAVLDARLAALPAPSSAARKEAFLETLLAAGPVITAIPAAPPRAGRTLRELLEGWAWKPVGGVAAVALVGVGVWQLRPAPTTVAERPGPRSGLVKKVIGHQQELALKEADTFRRMDRLTALATDLEQEAREVCRAAGPDEMRALADMYAKVVDAGVVGQAGRIDRFARAGDRRDALDRAAKALGAAAKELRNEKPKASPDAQPSLEKMATAAQDAQARLLQIRGG